MKCTKDYLIILTVYHGACNMKRNVITERSVCHGSVLAVKDNQTVIVGTYQQVSVRHLFHAAYVVTQNTGVSGVEPGNKVKSGPYIVTRYALSGCSYPKNVF